jgi:hypothetical protein
MKKFNDLDKYINQAYKGDTILQLDVRKPFVFLFTIYGHFEKEVLVYKESKYDLDNTMPLGFGYVFRETKINFVRWLFFELDY